MPAMLIYVGAKAVYYTLAGVAAGVGYAVAKKKMKRKK